MYGSDILCGISTGTFEMKFHTKYLTHTLKDVAFIHKWKFKSSKKNKWNMKYKLLTWQESF